MGEARLNHKVGGGGVEVVDDTIELGQLGCWGAERGLGWLLSMRRPPRQRSLRLMLVLLLSLLWIDGVGGSELGGSDGGGRGWMTRMGGRDVTLLSWFVLRLHPISVAIGSTLAKPQRRCQQQQRFVSG